MERGPDLLQNGLVKVFGDAIVFSLRSVTVSFLVVPAFLRGLENSSLKYSPPRSERGHLIQVLYGSTFLSFMDLYDISLPFCSFTRVTLSSDCRRLLRLFLF